ncbi:hypothetical protein H4Q26_014129 [Puccinia striiformis f. sp. tritici PST-130]|uniref:MaoC-like domain-containing protein n=1 Tax=Puccinia striiformis f. sp. tritici PST-78 TaxID=1165861 RepID=A0A0L0VV56_9BASI|nr:hypothetical protein H4Q26_014129 [Puccinia striiformis f. sp. tritici PST-130]KNF03146.1 hypothetical protein PSTG_03733 [Puccinia striiformis f. sp. tritici PST-78]
MYHGHVHCVVFHKESVCLERFSHCKPGAGKHLEQAPITLLCTATTPFQGDTVAEYLKRSGKPVGHPAPVATSSKMKATSVDSEIKPLPNNQPYSLASVDWNPIHCEPYFAHLVSLLAVMSFELLPREWMWKAMMPKSKATTSHSPACFCPTTLKSKLKCIGEPSKGFKLISFATHALPDKSLSSAKRTKVLVGPTGLSQALTGHPPGVRAVKSPEGICLCKANSMSLEPSGTKPTYI